MCDIIWHKEVGGMGGIIMIKIIMIISTRQSC